MRGVIALFFAFVFAVAFLPEAEGHSYYYPWSNKGWRYSCRRWKSAFYYCQHSRQLCEHDLRDCRAELCDVKQQLDSCIGNSTQCLTDLDETAMNLTECENANMELKSNLTDCNTNLTDCKENLEAMKNVCTEDTCGIHGECVVNMQKQPFCICDPGYCGTPCMKSSETTGASCSPPEPCRTPGTVCVDGQCVCKCGTTYVPDLLFSDVQQSRDICVQTCPNGLSSTFITYPNQMIGNDDGTMISNVASKAACEANCIAHTAFVCRSIEYRPDTKVCVLNLAGKDDPVRFVESANKDYAERVCA